MTGRTSLMAKTQLAPFSLRHLNFPPHPCFVPPRPFRTFQAGSAAYFHLFLRPHPSSPPPSSSPAQSPATSPLLPHPRSHLLQPPDPPWFPPPPPPTLGVEEGRVTPSVPC